MDTLEKIAEETQKITLSIDTNAFQGMQQNFHSLTKSFYEEHFDIPRILYFFDVDKATRILDSLSFFPKSLTNYNELLEKFYYALLRETSLISPFDLPIYSQADENLLFGSFGSINFPYKKLNISYLKRFYIAILLNERRSLLTPCAYAHEMAHIMTPVLGITDEDNNEFIPIFIEKVIASHLHPNILKTIESARLQSFSEVLSHINCPSNYMSSYAAYIYSTLNAINLFDKYQNSNASVQKEILKDINLIFNGFLTVEDLLEKYDITKENSQNLALIRKHM